jgi:hypothetical protein
MIVMDLVMMRIIFGKLPKNVKIQKIYPKSRIFKKMTDFLDNLANDQHQKMLREIANDDKTPKKRDSLKESELFDIDEVISHTEPTTLNEF